MLLVRIWNAHRQLGYKLGFLEDAAVWLLMMKKRNASVHMYNEDDMDEMILLIHDSFVPAFTALEKTLKEKLEAAGRDWEDSASGIV